MSAGSRGLRVWLALPLGSKVRWLARKVRDALPGMQHIASADRRLLEGDLLRAYAADPALRQLLFVGCEWYTQDYAQLFAPDVSRFRTVDIDPAKARYGSAGHIVAPVQEMARHLPAGSIDVIVCNGVYGFGVDDEPELARTFAAAHAVLAPGGKLLLGWNDVPVLGPFDPEPVAREAGFDRDEARPDGWRQRTDTPTRHTFDFYVKRLATPAPSPGGRAPRR